MRGCRPRRQPVLSELRFRPIDATLLGLASARQALSNVIASSGAVVVFNLGFVVLLLLCRVISRRNGLAVAIFLALMSITAGGRAGVDPRGAVVYGLIVWSVILVILFRFGLLTLIVSEFVSLIATAFPLTTHAAAWYSGRSLLVLAVVGALAAYGFRFATTTRRGPAGAN